MRFSFLCHWRWLRTPSLIESNRMMILFCWRKRRQRKLRIYCSTVRHICSLMLMVSGAGRGNRQFASAVRGVAWIWAHAGHGWKWIFRSLPILISISMSLCLTHAKMANHVYVRGCFATRVGSSHGQTGQRIQGVGDFFFCKSGELWACWMFCELTVTSKSPGCQFHRRNLEKCLVFWSAEMMKKKNPPVPFHPDSLCVQRTWLCSFAVESCNHFYHGQLFRKNHHFRLRMRFGSCALLCWHVKALI